MKHIFILMLIVIHLEMFFNALSLSANNRHLKKYIINFFLLFNIIECIQLCVHITLEFTHLLTHTCSLYLLSRFTLFISLSTVEWELTKNNILNIKKNLIVGIIYSQ